MGGDSDSLAKFGVEWYYHTQLAVIITQQL
jgi:hypothetical protein